MDMKKLVLCIAVLFSSQLFAQSNLTMFTDEGEKFTLFLNGVQQNQVLKSNIHVENIKANTQKLRIVFEDKNIPNISENIFYENYKDHTYVIRKKKNTASQVKRLDGKPSPVNYVVRLQDVKPLDRIQISNKVDEIQSLDVETSEVKPDEDVITNITTTTTKTNNKPSNENVNINIGVNGMGINMNVSGIENQNNTVTSTTTTTTTTQTKSNTNAYANDNNVVKPKTNCAAMSPSTMGSVLDQMKKQSFEDNKMNVIKQVLGSNCISTTQVKQLMSEFSFEENKLKVAKMCYAKTTDKGNYFILNDAFSFSSSADELQEFLETKGSTLSGEE
jgi:hypothetical protein